MITSSVPAVIAYAALMTNPLLEMPELHLQYTLDPYQMPCNSKHTNSTATDSELTLAG